MKHMKGKGFFLIIIMFLGLTCTAAVTAHPGHGTPIEEPSDTDTTDTSSISSTSSGSTTSSSTSSSSSSSGGHSTNYNSINEEDQSSQTGKSNNYMNMDNNVSSSADNGPEELSDNFEAHNVSPGGPVAMMGLMVFIGLIAMAFPYKEGGAIHKIQEGLFGG